MEPNEVTPGAKVAITRAGFWRTIPGILAGLAALITAVGGLIVILNAAGFLGGDDPPPPPSVTRLEAEAAIDISPDQVMARSEASDARTALVVAPRTLPLGLTLDDAASCVFMVRYSNDNFGDLEQVAIAVDGDAVDRFDTRDTGGEGGGWNLFETSEPMGPVDLAQGPHRVELTVTGGDDRGIEVDYVEASCG